MAKHAEFNSRRDLLKALGAGSILALSGLPLVARAGSKARVVVIGAGFGGATAAKYIRLYDPSIEVTLIEKKANYISCPLSNEVLAGDLALDSLTWEFIGLEKYGVKIVQGEATAVDAAKKTVKLSDGSVLNYDKLVLSPGIDFNFAALEGMTENACNAFPHAYQAGEQTMLLRRQLEAMPDGGKFVIVVPPKPFRCPPGPYERAAQASHYFKHHKPKSKVVILDSNDSFSKKALFEQAWTTLYPGMIEWVSGASDGKVQRVDVAKRKLITEFSEHSGDVINIIPPHRAGKIAQLAGVTDATGWCPIDPMSMASTIHKDIHVVGDACISGEPAPFDMPKSAHAAMTQSKVAAGAIVAMLNGQAPAEPYFVNTCYSLCAPDYGFSVVHIFRVVDGKFKYIKEAGGVSPVKTHEWTRKAEAEFARGWYRNIAMDAFT
jgi:sulfide dehydrogenase [flavocytochrome c] flavoprotein subunit